MRVSQRSAFHALPLKNADARFCPPQSWNMHLSNSAYNRALDYARMGHLFRVLVRSGSDGAFMALGGASYSYHREVPIGAKYDLEIGLYAWDEKWLCESSATRRLSVLQSSRSDISFVPFG